MVEHSQTFDSVAALYDAQRTGYPAALFEDLGTLAGLTSGARVLEVGCGSGQATAGLVAAGADVTAIDPGGALLAIARTRLADVAHVCFEQATFESWDSHGQDFDLIAAAQSWHWVPAETGYAKAAELLKPGGHLAVLGHTPSWSPALTAILQPIYERRGLWGAPSESWYLADGPIPGLFAQSGCFDPVQHRRYDWSRAYTGEGFAAYLETRSDHNVLPADLRDSLLSDIIAALPADLETHWQTNLYVAKVRGT